MDWQTTTVWFKFRFRSGRTLTEEDDKLPIACEFKAEEEDEDEPIISTTVMAVGMVAAGAEEAGVVVWKLRAAESSLAACFRILMPDVSTE